MNVTFLLALLLPLGLTHAQTQPAQEPAQARLSIQTGAPVLALAYSPDGKRIATGGQEREVVLWNAQSGERIMTLKGHTDDVVTVQFSPNGRFLASGGVDNALILWDAITGDIIRKTTDHTDYVRDVAFSPDSRLLATA
ncbi:MAG: hypothetical protein EOO77_40340, partial [Oxalobacteraceae bacterium]